MWDMDLPGAQSPQRPTTPNTVMYDDEAGPPKSAGSLRARQPPPGPPTYLTPRDKAAGEVVSLGGGKPTIWTVEGDQSNEDKLKGTLPSVRFKFWGLNIDQRNQSSPI